MNHNDGTDVTSYQPGDIVYVLFRNPHVQDVANVQAAAVVSDPEIAGGLAIFLYDTYYPLTEEVAVYTTEREAEQAYYECFGGFADTEAWSDIGENERDGGWQ